MYSLLIRDQIILGSQNVYFLATWAEITNLHKSKKITFQMEDSRYHRFQQTPWLAPNESNIYEYNNSKINIPEHQVRNPLFVPTGRQTQRLH